MKLLPLLLGVALLVLIMETGEAEGGPRTDSDEGGEAVNGKRLQIRSFWEKLKKHSKKYKEKAKDYLEKKYKEKAKDYLKKMYKEKLKDYLTDFLAKD